MLSWGDLQPVRVHNKDRFLLILKCHIGENIVMTIMSKNTFPHVVNEMIMIIPINVVQALRLGPYLIFTYLHAYSI